MKSILALAAAGAALFLVAPSSEANPYSSCGSRSYGHSYHHGGYHHYRGSSCGRSYSRGHYYRPSYSYGCRSGYSYHRPSYGYGYGHRGYSSCRPRFSISFGGGCRR